MRFDILSLFTGAGALDAAFESTGVCQSKVVVESNPVFCETLKRNRERWIPAATIVEADVETLDPFTTWQKRGQSTADFGIIGGPPCQPFSRMGQKQGTSDQRGLLVFTFHRWVDLLKPNFFVLENVPDLETRKGTGTIEALEQAFRDSGYVIARKVLNAADFGAATKRKRLFLVGFLDAPGFVFPDQTHSKSASENDLFGRSRWVSSMDVLQGLPAPHVAEPHYPQAHQLIQHTTGVIERFSTIKPGGYDHVRKRARLHADSPSPSLVAGDLNGIRWAIHPVEDRELTNREAARIHGFPDWFEFAGNHAAIGVQIANAVPVALGSAVAKAVVAHAATCTNGAPVKEHR